MSGKGPSRGVKSLDYPQTRIVSVTPDTRNLIGMSDHSALDAP